MFRVFSRFNLLLTRTRVRAAVKDFQVQLISTVSDAVQKLQSKFTLKYESSAAARISRLRGIPPVAGKILWAKQMERQVHTLMERMAAVLGPNWGQQLEGRQLRKSTDELLAKLDAHSFFRKWVAEWEKDIAESASSRLHSYPIVVGPDASSGGALIAKVNFDDKSGWLFKEIRHLKWLGFGNEIPKTLDTSAAEASTRYPYAVGIKTALRSYQSVRVLVTPDLELLVMPELLNIRECISEVFDVKLATSTAVTKKQRIRWDNKEMKDWVTRFADGVTKFEERIEQLLKACDKVDVALRSMEDVEYDPVKFQEIVAIIQATIDEMSLSGYSDLESWVRVVGDRMAKVLSKRLYSGLQAWIDAFSIQQVEEEKIDGDQEKAPAVGSRPVTVDVSITLEIVLRNQEISSAPAVPVARSIFLNKLHEFMGVVCGLQRPKSGRYEVFDSSTPRSASRGGRSSETFDDLVQSIPPDIVAKSYGVIEQHVQNASSFVDQWLAYQTLWDTQVSDVAAMVGTDIAKWQELLTEAAEARSTLDASATVADFGPFTVKFGKVQSQINLKYDSWQKELQSSFSSILGQCINETHEKISTAKTKLEETTLDSASTESIVLGVTFIQEVKQKAGPWLKEIDNLGSSEKLLKKQRFAFHSEWVETSVVRGLYDSLMQILERRTRTMEQQIPLLQARVSAEDKTASKQLSELLKNWEQEKPLRGNVSPPEALEALTKYEISMKKAHVHQENLIRAKDALGLEHSLETNEVVECLNELSDLKEVWEAMMEPHSTLEEIKDTPWATAVMRKVKRALDDLLASMRSLSNRIRQYDAYTQLHDTIKSYISGHGLLSDLKTESLKER